MKEFKIASNIACGGIVSPAAWLSPAARLLCGVLVLTISLFLSSLGMPGVAASLLVVLVWTRICTPRSAYLPWIVKFATGLFLATLLLQAPLLFGNSTSRYSFFITPFRIAFHSLICAFVSVATLSSLRVSELQSALETLRVPASLRTLLLQIVLQTLLLFKEVRRTVAIMMVRGAANATLRVRIRVLSGWPQVWFARLLNKAERVGMVMEVRGFGVGSVRERGRGMGGAGVGEAHAVLSFKGVSVRYPGAKRCALEGIDFQVRAGERVALIGLNGSGKTTLLLTAVGLLPFDGEITVCGVNLNKRSAHRVRGSIGFLFSAPDEQLLLPDVLDDVAFSLERRGVSRPEARTCAQAMLKRLGIGHLVSNAPHQLSQGEQTLVALAGALVHEPPLLLLDEPSAALDRPSREELARLLELPGTTMVMATHDEEFARRVCSRAIHLADGGVAGDALL